MSKHKATSQVLELTYQIGGKTVWSYTSTTSPPHFLDLEENETIDQALAREMSQDPENFNNVWLPSYVARGGDDGKPLGISATPGGSFN